MDWKAFAIGVAAVVTGIFVTGILGI